MPYKHIHMFIIGLGTFRPFYIHTVQLFPTSWWIQISTHLENTLLFDFKFRIESPPPSPHHQQTAQQTRGIEKLFLCQILEQNFLWIILTLNRLVCQKLPARNGTKYRLFIREKTRKNYYIVVPWRPVLRATGKREKIPQRVRCEICQPFTVK
jgi:hypothetical protein